MELVNDADGGSRMTGFGHLCFDALVYCYSSIDQQSGPERKHVPCALLQKILGADLGFFDDLEAAILVDHQIFGIPVRFTAVQDIIPDDISRRSRAIIIPIYCQYGVGFFCDAAGLCGNIASVNVVGKSSLQVFGRGEEDVSDIYCGIVYPYLMDRDRDIFIGITFF